MTKIKQKKKNYMMESMRIKINMYITYNTLLLTIFSSSRAEYCTYLLEYI